MLKAEGGFITPAVQYCAIYICCVQMKYSLVSGCWVCQWCLCSSCCLSSLIVLLVISASVFMPSVVCQSSLLCPLSGLWVLIVVSTLWSLSPHCCVHSLVSQSSLLCPWVFFSCLCSLLIIVMSMLSCPCYDDEVYVCVFLLKSLSLWLWGVRLCVFVLKSALVVMTLCLCLFLPKSVLVHVVMTMC